MTHTLPELPYAYDALVPALSAETLMFHYDKHHGGYVKKLNKAIAETKYAGLELEEIIAKADPGEGVFNNAAQVWNHTFYWQSMKPGDDGKPRGELADAVDAAFGNLDKFREKFIDSAAGVFGSGWAWLLSDKDGNLSIETSGNAETFATDAKTPLLTCDVWEHAYYIDYRNDRAKYLENFVRLINWEFAEKNYTRRGSMTSMQQDELAKRRASAA